MSDLENIGRRILYSEKLTELDKKKCNFIACYVIFQCLGVFIGSYTILDCYWSPYKASNDFSKLARVQYLHDYTACNSSIRLAKSIKFKILAQKMKATDLKPKKLYKIQSKSPPSAKTAKLATNTRRYIKSSIGFHIIWVLTAVVLIIVVNLQLSYKILSYSLTLYFYYSVLMICFDMSMAIVYVAHIQESLTKSMILRYSGWSVELTVSNPDEFAGWMPIAASAAWLKGVFITVVNVINTRVIRLMNSRLRKKEVKKKVEQRMNRAIPDPFLHYLHDDDILLLRRP